MSYGVEEVEVSRSCGLEHEIYNLDSETTGPSVGPSEVRQMGISVTGVKAKS